MSQKRNFQKIWGKRKLAGVCAGFGDYFGFNANFARVGFLILTLLTYGLGFVLYVALALLMPKTEEDRTAGKRISVLTIVFAFIAPGWVVGLFFDSIVGLLIKS